MKIHSHEAEQHILGCALVDQQSVPSLLEIPEEWFYENQNKLIYRAISELAKASLDTDAFSVGEHLNQQQQLDMAGGMEYVNGIAEALPSPEQFRSFKNILFKYYKVRQISKIKDSLEQQLGTNAKPEQMVEWLSGAMVELMTDHHQGGFKTIDDHLNEVLDEVQWRQENQGQLLGQKSGYEELDDTIDGFQDGRVYVIAGRPGSGKTAFALALSEGLARNGKPWFYFSLEMTGKSLAKRMLVRASRVFNTKFRSGAFSDHDNQSLAAGIVKLKNIPVHVDETAGLSIAQIRSRLKAAQIKHKDIGGIIIDHIGLVKKDNNKTDTEAMNIIADELLRMAKDFECPMVELCQLNRGVEGRMDKRPLMSDLKQSGKIEENADVIMLLYRADYYDKQERPITEVDTAKNRDGETKTVYFKHEMALGDYEELAGYAPEEKPKKKL